jgi:hypothetical protein
LETVTVVVDESVVLPLVSVARAISVYVPLVGWLDHVTLYGGPLAVLPMSVPAE